MTMYHAVGLLVFLIVVLVLLRVVGII